MPLFSKRSRSLSTTRPITPASSSAHLAAAQAFAASQSSQSNLSASAAATALRTMSPAPTPVHQIQTKRMLNRQPSNSSVTSASRGRSRGNVQRRTSAGSMTERTFRSPSPGQQSPQTGPITGAEKGAPPVPPLPQSYVIDDIPPIPVKSHRRSASMDAPPPRVSSPLSGRPAGRGQNVQQATTGSSAATTAARRSANLPLASELQRSDSQDSSVNYSYPRGSRPNSPPPRVSSPSNGNGASATTKSASGLSALQAARIQSNLAQTAAQPVKKKKNRSAVEGSHFQAGTMGGKPTVTPLEPLPADYEPPVAEPVQKPKKKAALTGQASHFPDHGEQHVAADEASDSDATPESPRDRRAMRSAGVLMKQPSVVREDWEGEQEDHDSSPIEATTIESARTPISTNTTKSIGKKPAPEANMSRKIEDPPPTSKSSTAVHDAVTLHSPRVAELNKSLSPVNADAQVSRGVSVSPSRSTRFSDRLASDLASGRKHEPLGRSMSPAKSALKHSSISSDVSPSDPRYTQRRGSSVTPSEASDASVDGTSRRKTSRVSFEGFAEAKDSLADVRSSKEPAKKNWLGYGKGRGSSLNPIYADEEVEEGMKPRPELPSFGSVRRSERSNSPTAEATHSANRTASSSETSSIADPPTMNTSISSDHALGGLISRQTHAPITSDPNQYGHKTSSPIVASTGTRGYDSDSGSEYSNDEDQHYKAAQVASQKLGRSVGSTGSSAQNEEIPVIAVQPATPGIDELRSGKEWAGDVPGGFPGSQTSSDTSLRNVAPEQVEAATPVKQGTGLGFVDPPENYSTANTSDTPIGSPPQQLMTIDEEDSDAYSVYSDAAEDLSDLEGDGFGSINAIVGSPAIAAVPARKNTVPESPLASGTRQRPDVPERTTSWDDAQAHWSGLAQNSRNIRQEIPQSAATPTSTVKPSVVVPVKVRETKTSTKPVTAKSSSVASTTKPTPSREPAQNPKNSATVAAVSTRSSTTKPQGALRSSMRDRSEQSSSSGQPKPALRSSMRDRQESSLSSQQKPAMRASMRGGPEPGISGQQKPALRSSMRGSSEPPVQRPVSSALPTSASRAALQKKNIPPTAAPKAPVRRFSNDSDSDSSFRKARRNRRQPESQFTMKRSMRGNAADTSRQSAPTLRAGVRSLSPPTDRRPTSPSMALKSMRSTMRGSADLGTPTLRPQLEQKRSSSLFSRNRTTKSPTRPTSAVPALPSKLKSRLADSDDEDGPRPTRFKSRFGDSSDEDEPADLRPVRGIPKRKDDRDSTDLDDSSDEEAKRSKANAKKLAMASPPMTEDAMSPPASPSGAKKRGFWGRLRGKKREDEESVVLASQSTVHLEDKLENMKGKDAEYNNSKQLGFDSTAERDAMIEQTRLMLEARNEAKAPAERPQSPGKLQRRITPQRVFSDSYATPKLPAASKDRPQTSDGYDNIARPTAGSRQATQDRVNGEAVVGKSGKKKKFGFLRKAFGLTD